MNILVLTTHYPVTSAGTKRVHSLLQHEDLISKNNLLILSYRSNSKITKESGVFEGVRYRRIGSGLKIDVFLLFKLFLIQCRLMYELLHFRFFEKANSNKYILYNYLPLDLENVFFNLIAKMLGFKLVFDVVEDYSTYNASSNFMSKLKLYFVRFFSLFIIHLGDYIIVISDYLLNKYIKNGAVNIKKITICSDVNLFSCLESVQKDSFNIGYAGTFSPKDNVGLIIRGFLNFNSVYPNSRLYLIGSGHEKVEFETIYGLESSIMFTGFVEDNEYYKLLKCSDVLLMCRTNSEFANAGFPFKLGEYLATGNPVICTRVSDIEYYLDSNSAVLIEPDNETAYVNALISVYNNRDYYKQIGKNGRLVSDKFFNAKFCSDEFYKIVINL
jgi:glycosyltransferase involved in cell wall biosynthesis